jgi:hypothetical protein
VTPDLDTLLTALYVEIDGHVIPSGRRRPGQPKRLSDAELVCLAVARLAREFRAPPDLLSDPDRLDWWCA